MNGADTKYLRKHYHPGKGAPPPAPPPPDWTAVVARSVPGFRGSSPARGNNKFQADVGPGALLAAGRPRAVSPAGPTARRRQLVVLRGGWRRRPLRLPAV